MSKVIHKVKMEKGNRQIYLPTTSYMDFFKNNYTIIYPNGGSKEHPANIVTSKEYIEPNPFPGYIVHCVPEVLYLEEWGNPQWTELISGDHYAYGVRATQHNDGDIHIVTGNYCILLARGYKHTIAGYSFNSSQPNHIYQLPCRVKVWKVGVIE